MKNMIEIAQDVKKADVVPDVYLMTAGDMMELFHMAKHEDDGLWDALSAAFYYGFRQGNHCTVNRKMKKL